MNYSFHNMSHYFCITYMQLVYISCTKTIAGFLAFGLGKLVLVDPGKYSDIYIWTVSFQFFKILLVSFPVMHTHPVFTVYILSVRKDLQTI